MNISFNNLFTQNNGYHLKSTEEKMERIQKTQSQIDFSHQGFLHPPRQAPPSQAPRVSPRLSLVRAPLPPRQSSRQDEKYILRKYECMKADTYQVEISERLYYRATKDKKIEQWLEDNLSQLSYCMESLRSIIAVTGGCLVRCICHMNNYNNISTEIFASDNFFLFFFSQHVRSSVPFYALVSNGTYCLSRYISVSFSSSVRHIPAIQ